MSPPARIAVVGGGIVGASIAYELARRGADVTVLERTHAAAGATARSFAWINASFDKRPFAYYQLSRLGMLGWSALERELGAALPIQWGGSLAWFCDPAGARGLERAVQEHQSWGYPARLIDREQLRALEPGVEPGSALAVAHAPDEAVLDPSAATLALLGAARKQAARVLAPAEVTGFELRGDHLVGLATTLGEIPASTVVLAAGVDTPRLAARVGLRVPLVESPGVLAHTRPLGRRLNRVLLAPEIHIKQGLDGRVVIGEHAGGFHSSDTSLEYGERLLVAASHWVPGLAGASLERVTLGQRPVPADGLPILGFCAGSPRVYLAVTHSGVTLAPVIGALASLEILDGARVELLEPYRLSRFGACPPVP
jgi:glycine/D-amino acid oxidase-like deaminating enzyme